MINSEDNVKTTEMSGSDDNEKQVITSMGSLMGAGLRRMRWLFGAGQRTAGVIVAFLLFTAISADAQEVSKTIKGQILNEEGSPIENLEVKLANATGTSDYTDAEGNYEVTASSYPTGIKELINNYHALEPGIIKREIYDLTGRLIHSDRGSYFNGRLENMERLKLTGRQIFIQYIEDENGNFRVQKFMTDQQGMQAPMFIDERKPERKPQREKKSGNTETHGYILLLQGTANNGFTINENKKVEGFLRTETEHKQDIFINTNPENYILIQGKITELLNNNKPTITCIEIFNAEENLKTQGTITNNNFYKLTIPKDRAGELLALHLEGSNSMPIFHGVTIKGDTTYNLKTIDSTNINKKVAEQAVFSRGFTNWWHPDLLKINPETGKNGITN